MQTTRGILRPAEGLSHFDLDRAEPPADLAPFVERFWTVRWKLPRGTSFAQEILPFPCVNLACEEGRYAGDVQAERERGFYVHGPGRRRFVARLDGSGWVAGVKFRPGGFFAFSTRPMKELVDRIVPAAEAMKTPPPSVPAQGAHGRRALIEYLRARLPSLSNEATLANSLVERVQSDRSLATAEDLARSAGVSLRSLHRLLEKYVGVSSKWIVRRARVQDAADRVARGEKVDWATVAAELGYYDQAHLIRDFKAQIGFTPAAYARRCAAARASA